MNYSSRSMALLLSISSLALTACGFTVLGGGGGVGGDPGAGGNTGVGGNAGCASDADCPPGQVCGMNGQCFGNNNQVEICNGLDDDGDGLIDNEGMTPLCGPNSQCVNGQCSGANACDPMNACPPGQVCDPATGMCVPSGPCMPSPEVCDGVDNDCNGLIDEDPDPNGFLLCPNGGVCVNGACSGQLCMTDADCPMGELCDPATATCSPGPCVPSPEVCDGLDNNCNGFVDEGSGGALLICANGGICMNGVCTVSCMSDADCPMGQVCDPATATCSAGPCMPQPETCDGIDNDCDGIVDEQDPNFFPLCPPGQMCVNGGCS